MKNAIFAILAWLDGKKTYIFGAAALTVAYLGAIGVIDQMTQSYIASLIVLFAGGTEYSTVKLGARQYQRLEGIKSV